MLVFELGVEGEVLDVASEEGRAVVEAQVDEGPVVGDRGEKRAVGDGPKGALVRGAQRGAVGPVGHVRGGVNGEDDVHGAHGLDQRVERDVLQVFAAVDQVQLDRVRVGVGLVVPVQERVGDDLRHVVLGLPDVFKHLGHGLDEDVRHAVVVGHVGEQELVEERAARAHDETGLVQTLHALAVGGDDAVGEVGAEVFRGSKAEDGRVPAAHLKGVELEVSSVERDDGLPRRAAVSYQDGERRVGLLEAVALGNAGEGVGRPAHVVSDQLVAQCAAPVVCYTGLEAGILLLGNFLGHLGPVLDAVDSANAGLLGSLEDGVLKVPDFVLAQQRLDAAEVVGEQTANKPTTTGKSSPTYVVLVIHGHKFLGLDFDVTRLSVTRKRHEN